MKLALLQMSAACGAPEENLDRIAQAMAQAAERGADMLLAPELAMTGYGAGDVIRGLAQSAGGAWIEHLKALARQRGVAVVAGFAERDGAEIFNSAVYAATDGETAIYRKSHLYGDYEKRLFRAGSPHTVMIEHAGLKFGMLICYDVEFPENVRRLAMADADAVLVPTALPAGEHAAFIAEKLVPVRAFENQIFIAYANHAGADDNFAYAGLSCIAAPDGTMLAAAPPDAPALLFATLEPGRYDLSRAQNTYLRDLAG